MLVDLARNDVGRVARFGTRARRRADDARALQPRDAPDVAGVGRRCVDGLGPIDVLRATLPAGTVSGAPKVRAMEIIDDLEPVKRGPYAGVVGYVDWSGNLDTAIAIRTMFCRPDGHEPAGRRRHRRRLGPRRRGPRVPQQGGRPARRDPGRPADDRRPPRRRHAGLRRAQSVQAIEEEEPEDRRTPASARWRDRPAGPGSVVDRAQERRPDQARGRSLGVTAIWRSRLNCTVCDDRAAQRCAAGVAGRPHGLDDDPLGRGVRRSSVRGLARPARLACRLTRRQAASTASSGAPTATTSIAPPISVHADSSVCRQRGQPERRTRARRR